MKLKFLAAAAALACGSTAFAGINKTDNDAELFFVVWDESFATYVLDTGLTLGTLMSQGTAKTWTFTPGARFNAYKGLDKNLDDFEVGGTGTGTRYGLIALDDNIFPLDGSFDAFPIQYLTTTTRDKAPTLSNQQLSGVIVDKMGEFVARQNRAGPQPINLSNNNDVTVDKESEAHFLEGQYGGQQGLFAGNAINSGAAALSYCSLDAFLDDPFAAAKCSMTNNKGLEMSTSFDGMTFSVTAVPEPGTYAMLLAGLAAVGFAARRRQRG